MPIGFRSYCPMVARFLSLLGRDSNTKKAKTSAPSHPVSPAPPPKKNKAITEEEEKEKEKKAEEKEE